jgi:hypothetical protein
MLRDYLGVVMPTSHSTVQAFDGTLAGNPRLAAPSAADEELRAALGAVALVGEPTDGLDERVAWHVLAGCATGYPTKS